MPLQGSGWQIVEWVPERPGQERQSGSKALCFQSTGKTQFCGCEGVLWVGILGPLEASGRKSVGFQLMESFFSVGGELRSSLREGALGSWRIEQIESSFREKIRC